MPESSFNRKFVWPPRPLPTRDTSIAANPPPAPSTTTRNHSFPSLLSRLRAALSEIERDWLDPIALPLAQRAKAAGWSPDEPTAYCDHCGRDIGAYEANELRCSRCANSRLPWERCVRLGRYEAPLSDWICEVKFTRWRVLGFELGRMLGRQLRTAGFNTTHRNTVIVPIPTSFRRRLSRGIDHAAVIARGVAWELDLPLIRALKRKHRPSQRAVALSDRTRNVSGSISLRPDARLAGKTVLLIDDVMTTGATLRTAARALASPPPARRPAALWTAILAVTPDPA
ncbi:MAG: ComF family protein [Phycisphaerae bacterium]|nr:ComF family protein [Phycisphaerae bacterium]